MRTIVIANQKGGVAKTTTCGALASVLTRRGYRILSIDMDPQGSLTDNCGVEQSEHGVYNVLLRNESIRDCIRQTAVFDILPASILMAALEQQLSGEVGRECRLREAVRKGGLEPCYDFILIDCPPALGTLTVNALVCGDYVVIPINSDVNALTGVAKLHSTITSVQEYFNDKLQIAGILQTRDNARYIISKEIREIAGKTARELNCKLMESRIRTCVSIPESHYQNVDIYDYDPSSTVAQDYEAFATELLSEVGT